jgi:hypothetical protein
MQSTLTKRDADPHDMFVIEPDVVLAARAEPPEKRRQPDMRALVSEISAGVAAQAAAPKVDTSFRAAPLEKRRSRWVTSFIVAFLFALLSAVGAAAWQRYGEEAQALVEAVSPVIASWQTPAAPVPSAPATPAVATDADQTAAPAEAPTQATDAAAPASPDQTQQIQVLTRDLAAMGQQVEALKAGVAELKATQDQVTRDAKAAEAKAAEAKAFEQNMRAKVSALPPRPPVAPVKKPKPPVQAASAPLLPPPGAPAPTQIAPPPPVSSAPQDQMVPRPPMPVR